MRWGELFPLPLKLQMFLLRTPRKKGERVNAQNSVIPWQSMNIYDSRMTRNLQDELVDLYRLLDEVGSLESTLQSGFRAEF